MEIEDPFGVTVWDVKPKKISWGEIEDDIPELKTGCVIRYQSTKWVCTQVFFQNEPDPKVRRIWKKYFHRWLTKSGFLFVKLTGDALNTLRQAGFAEQRAPVGYLVKKEDIENIVAEYKKTRARRRIDVPNVIWIEIGLQIEK
jgi:hypothetical protein